jgi:hypothetical protein
MHVLLKMTAAALCGLAFSSIVQAMPVFDEFGPLDEATFGGSGIPNQNVAISGGQGITSGQDIFTLTLGLTAHQRFFNPPLSHDGAGTFTAGAGTSFSPGGLEGALWNFAFFVGVEGATIEDLVNDGYSFILSFNFDPSDAVDAGTILLDGATGSVVQGSQNLLFSFLSDGVPGLVFPPLGSFDPTIGGLYSFSLTALNTSGNTQVDPVVAGIDVRVVAVPVPASLLLFGFGLLAAGAAFRRRQA